MSLHIIQLGAGERRLDAAPGDRVMLVPETMPDVIWDLDRFPYPYFSSANSYTDPTHRRHLGYRSFDYSTGENQWGFYSRARFEKRRAEIVFHPTLANRIVLRLARRWLDLWQRRFAWMFPAWFLSFEPAVVKESP